MAVMEHVNMGGPVVRPLAARAKGPGFHSPSTQHVQSLQNLQELRDCQNILEET